MPEALTFPFVQRALLAAALAAPLLGLLSPVVVARKLAFFSAVIGQAALTGVALGVLLGEPVDAPYASVIGFSLLFGLGLVWLRRRTQLTSDTLVGVALAFSLGLGVCLLVAVTKRFNVHQVEAALFGSVLTVTPLDLALLGAVLILTAALLLPQLNALLLDTVDPGLAHVAQLRRARNEYLFITVLTLAIVVSVKVMGALMVEALLVVPAATAQQVTKSFRGWQWLSVAVALVASVGGVLVSTWVSVPSGAAIVLVLSGLFAVSVALRRR